MALAAFVVIVGLTVGGYLLYQGTRPPQVVEGVSAPDFTFPLLDGGEASLSDYRGKVVLINVWNTSCLTCREEMPLMQREYEQLKGRPFELLAISTDAKGEEVVTPFLEDIGTEAFGNPGALTFPVLLDRENSVEDTYQTRRYPESFIIDKDGTVSRIIIGPLTRQDFALIKDMIER